MTAEIGEINREKFRDGKIRRTARQLVHQNYPDVFSLTHDQIAEIEAQHKQRRREIRSLQEIFDSTSGSEREDIENQLGNLQAHQFAARMVIETYRGRRFEI